MRVHLLCCCKEPDSLYGNLLWARTIRTGFPDAEIHVYDASTVPEAKKAIADAAESVRAEYEELAYLNDTERATMSEHGLWIEWLLDEAGDEPYAVVDPDVIFWQRMDDIEFPETVLLAGRPMPEITEMGARIPPRLHPSLLFFPRPGALRARIAEIRQKTPYFFPFRPYNLQVGPDRLISDTGCAIFAALGKDELMLFTGSGILDRYDHIFAGTMLQRNLKMGMTPDTHKALSEIHDIVKSGGDLKPLKGMWRAQEVGLKSLGPKPKSDEEMAWDHYTAVFLDDKGPAAALQMTYFYLPDRQESHAAFLDIRTGERKTYFGSAREVEDSLARAGVRWTCGLDEGIVGHGNGGTIERYGLACHHTSRPLVRATMELPGGDEPRKLRGWAWHDHERLPTEAVRGWDWLAVTFDDSSNLMIYAPAGEQPWGLYRDDALGLRKLAAADFRVEVEDTYLSERTGRIYGCLWRFSVVGTPIKAYAIRPFVQDQEMVPERMWPYWEGACEVLDGNGRRCGTAFFEAAGYPFANEQAMGLRWTRGDRDATALLRILARGSQLADDFVDDETPQADRGKNMIEMLDSALREIPENPFYQKHREALTPMVSTALLYWEASNDWAKSPRRTSRMFAFVMREALEAVAVGIALITGGREWARRVVREIHTYYHVLDDEPFEKWEAEHV